MDIGLTSERVQTIAESRLRAARLYDADSLFNLHVRVSVLSRVFFIEVAFNKVLFDVASATIFEASTWEQGSIGRSGDPGFILQGLSELLDRFILDYLRVNEDACNTSPGGAPQ